jgi:hypothetical protein
MSAFPVLTAPAVAGSLVLTIRSRLRCRGGASRAFAPVEDQGVVERVVLALPRAMS